MKRSLPCVRFGLALLFSAALALLLWHQAALREGVAEVLEAEAAGVYGPLLFIGLYACRPVLLLPASSLTLSAGLLFGLGWGICYTVIGSNLAAAVAYLLGRYGSDLLPRPRTLPERLEQAKAQMLTRGFVTVLSLRLLFVPHDLVSYLAGGLKLPYLTFALATLFGTLPVTVIIVSIGVATDTLVLRYLEGAKWLLIGLIVVTLGFLALKRVSGLKRVQRS